MAWAAAHYLAWTDDTEFALGDGMQLLVETARYWASRIERDADGSADRNHAQSIAQDQPGDVALARAERNANADLARALADGKRQHRVKTNRG